MFSQFELFIVCELDLDLLCFALFCACAHFDAMFGGTEAKQSMHKFNNIFTRYLTIIDFDGPFTTTSDPFLETRHKHKV